MRGHRPALLVSIATLLVAGLVAVASYPTSPSTAPESVAHRSRSKPPTTATVEVAAIEAPPEVPMEPVATTAAIAPVAPPQPWKLMLIGDSMAFTAGLGLAPHAGDHGFVLANEGINGCGVVRGGPYRYFGAERTMEPRCEAWPSAWTDALTRNEPHLVAIVVGRWELMDRMYDGRWTNLFDPAFAAYIESELDAALAIAGSRGARVAVFTSPYYRRGTAPGGGIFPEDDPARVDAVNVILRRIAERHQAAVIDVGGWLSPDGQYTPEVGGVRVRSDGVHLTRQTGDLLAPWLFPQLQSALLLNPAG